MKTKLVPMGLSDREAVIDIFNFYVENSFAAYPEHTLPYEFFDAFLTMCQGYPAVTARNEEGEVVGFGMLRPYNPAPTFARTAEFTCFIKPGWTGRGIGQQVLAYLTAEGGKKGITTLLASISSLNEGSIRFHVQNGFVERGRLVEVGLKKGRVFDVVYCQKILEPAKTG